ncbi:hypothetical protein QR680_006864 [Steinernema hermaphroditum]|uniref:RlpA-like protein double-psi beta-barrel domain-containing protein n=1 Tax=Steinernema hermaphroditum TaxID=289476 RepID=A0AA39HWQ7_9BILA|nr:hypothetical protein QR680_006864 [Steinernema hermaphroditum]
MFRPLLLLLAIAASTLTAFEFGEEYDGDFTYYDNSGYGACGSEINAAEEDLVAVSASFWTSDNTNNDPLCESVCVEVSYNGNSITVPVKDKCPSCEKQHLDLSKSAFEQLADIDEQDGDFTYYNDAGFGACGDPIDAATEDLVAVSYEWFSTDEFPNPNNDPVCKNVCVTVSYGGKSITVPVKDKCPSCNKHHLDLSQSAFQQLADLDVGHVYGAKFTFVYCYKNV